MSYDVVAPVYELLSRVYSVGRIHACKRSQLAEIQRGDRVLYVGAGSGVDAAMAAARGADVVVVELSAKMVAKAQRLFERRGVAHRIRLLQGDAFAHGTAGEYDVVVANFFLNVFAPPDMERMLGHLASLVRPGGRFLIADFAPPAGSAVWRGFQQFYYGAAALTFRLLARNPLHPIYDYEPMLVARGLELRGRRDFPTRRARSGLFRTWSATPGPTRV